MTMSCSSVGHRRDLDLVLLWPWHRPEATDPIGPLAWEPPYAGGAALEMAKRQIYIYIYISFDVWDWLM